MVSGPFVVLHHTGHGEPHFDLMLAVDDHGPLLTWRLSTWPVTPETRMTVLPAHRRAYLTYEGKVSGNRGRVRRVADGYFQSEAAPGGDEWRVTIAGRVLRLPLGQNLT